MIRTVFIWMFSYFYNYNVCIFTFLVVSVISIKNGVYNYVPTVSYEAMLVELEPCKLILHSLIKSFVEFLIG